MARINAQELDNGIRLFLRLYGAQSLIPDGPEFPLIAESVTDTILSDSNGLAIAQALITFGKAVANDNGTFRAHAYEQGQFIDLWVWATRDAGRAYFPYFGAWDVNPIRAAWEENRQQRFFLRFDSRELDSFRAAVLANNGPQFGEDYIQETFGDNTGGFYRSSAPDGISPVAPIQPVETSIPQDLLRAAAQRFIPDTGDSFSGPEGIIGRILHWQFVWEEGWRDTFLSALQGNLPFFDLQAALLALADLSEPAAFDRARALFAPYTPDLSFILID